MNYEKKIVSYRITDYGALSDEQLLLELQKYTDKINSAEEPVTINEFNWFFGVVLNVKHISQECAKRFGIDVNEKTNNTSALNDLLRKNGIGTSNDK